MIKHHSNREQTLGTLSVLGTVLTSVLTAYITPIVDLTTLLIVDEFPDMVMDHSYCNCYYIGRLFVHIDCLHLENC